MTNFTLINVLIHLFLGGLKLMGDSLLLSEDTIMSLIN